MPSLVDLRFLPYFQWPLRGGNQRSRRLQQQRRRWRRCTEFGVLVLAREVVVRAGEEPGIEDTLTHSQIVSSEDTRSMVVQNKTAGGQEKDLEG